MGQGWYRFKEKMPDNISDPDLEMIIYKIKKGMLLRPSESYRNNHKKHSSVRRSSITKKKGGKRRKKKTRKGRRRKKKTRRKRGKGGVLSKCTNCSRKKKEKENIYIFKRITF